MLNIFWCLGAGNVCIQECYIFLTCWPLHHIMTFISRHPFWSEVYLVWTECGYAAFFPSLFPWNIIYHPSLWASGWLRAEMSLLQAAYSWVLFLLSIQPLCAFWLVNSIHLHLGWLLKCKDLLLIFSLLPSGYFIPSLFPFPSVSV